MPRGIPRILCEWISADPKILRKADCRQKFLFSFFPRVLCWLYSTDPKILCAGTADGFFSFGLCLSGIVQTLGFSVERSADTDCASEIVQTVRICAAWIADQSVFYLFVCLFVFSPSCSVYVE